MEYAETNKKESNEKIDRFIKDVLNEEAKVTNEETKTRKHRKHYEQILQLNPNSTAWEVVVNGELIDRYETKEEAEANAEKLNFVYNTGLFEGIIQGKELQQKHVEEGLDVGVVLSIFETEDD